MKRENKKAREELGRSDTKKKMRIIEHLLGFSYKESQLILKATLQDRCCHSYLFWARKLMLA